MRYFWNTLYKFAGVQFNYVKRKGGEIQVTEKVTERICVIIALLALIVAVITDVKKSLRI